MATATKVERAVFGGAIYLAVAWAPAAGLAAPAEPVGPHARWLGQDGHDYCRTATTLGANDIQDLHIRIEGLPADQQIESALINRLGGGQWAVNGKGPWTWKAQLLREPNATTAELYLEPSHDEESSRLDIELNYRGGQVARLSLAGGRSNPSLFMPGATMAASWAGQEGHDWTGLDAAVGPDGFEDVRLNLTGISTRLEVKSLEIQAQTGAGWEYGLNPHRRSNAELVLDSGDRSRGSLFFSPDRDLNGQLLRLRMTYNNERSCTATVVGREINARRAMSKPPEIALTPDQMTSQWLGQDATDVTGRGDVHVVVRGLPPARVIVASALSDRAGGYWIYRRDSNVQFYPAAGSDQPASMPLALRRQDGAATAELFFQPYRDESDTSMVLRLIMDDGSTTVHRFVGQACDPYRRGPLPAQDSVDAQPGDDLHLLSGKFGTIRLAKGRYVLDRPLVFTKPITMTGDAQAILVFTQKPDEPAWSGAIEISASNTMLQGFSIRFAGAFRWAVSGPGGAAIIRTFHQPGSHDPQANLVLTQLDVESSPVAPPVDPKQLPEAPYLARLADATSGRITGNRLRGGTVDVAHGPWLISDNEHCGTVPGTVAWDAFAGHWLHDVTVERNRVRGAKPSGKTWRFISMNQLGQRVVIRGNDVSGVGMRDDDTIPNPNAPEILLTESYRLYYEGKPAARSSDGYVLQIPMVIEGVVRPGSMVSILTGAHAGQYCAIAQPITPTAMLMADPLPPGDYVISVAHGFVDGLIEGNRIDARGGKSALIVLAGNHWGLRLVNNHLLGGDEGLRLQSTPTESPLIWGWSHTPFLGFSCIGNVHEGSLRGVALDVYADLHSKTTSGRTYLAGTYRDNIIRWSRELSKDTHPQADAIRIGAHSGDDPGQMKLEVSGNCLVNTSSRPELASLSIRRATINGVAVAERMVELPMRAETRTAHPN